MRKKVLIVEDKYYEVKVSFNYVNALHMNNELDIKVANRSQAIPFDVIETYDYVFVDIKLGKNSDLDGYDILLKLEHEYPNVKNVIILTGNNKILENLKVRGIKGDYRVLIKPIDFSELVKMFTE